MRRTVLALGMLIALGACASSSARPTTPALTPGTTSRNNIITASEIAASGARSALVLIRNLRPQWLGSYKIYVGEIEYGGALSDVDPALYKEIRYYTPSEAQMRFPATRAASAGTIGTNGLPSVIQFNKQ